MLLFALLEKGHNTINLVEEVGKQRAVDERNSHHHTHFGQKPIDELSYMCDTHFQPLLFDGTQSHSITCIQGMDT